MALHYYLSSDRLQALAQGRDLPAHTEGAALFADICGFTALTEALALRLGERQGVEALTQPVGGVYDALITEVQRHGGHTLAFAGDAITCWFDQADDVAAGAPAAQRALQAALAMQAAVQRIGSQTDALALKVSVACGAARRFTVGDASIQTLDVLAGPPVAQAALADALARPGDVLLDAATAQALPARVLEWREHAGGRYALIDTHWVGPLPATFDAGLPTPGPLAPATLRPWVHPFVYERELAGQGLFVADLRPVVALFLHFGGRGATDQAPDDAAVRQLDESIAGAQRVLQRHGGVLLELTLGDKGRYLYAAFGAAQAHEDDAQRALRAALALRTLFTVQGGARIGLASGMLRVGGYGGRTRQSFGAQGDATNAAARLMMLAQPGEILTSGRIRAAVAQEFALQARAPIALKGKAEPMPVFALLGPQRQRAMRLQEADFVLPMVGREPALAELTQTLDEAAAGRGALLLVVAEAGMGKSRLLAEGTRLALRRGFVGYGGATAGDGVPTPYRPWHGVWTALLALDTAASPRALARAAEAALVRLAPEHAEAWPLLGAVLGLELPENPFTQALAPRDRKALLETLLVKALHSCAAEAALDGGGVLLVLEDLHAAEPLSLDLLAAVRRAAGDLPLVVWVSQRPAQAQAAAPAATIDVAEALARHAADGSSLPLRRIELGGLQPAQMALLIRAKLAAQFPERAGSVPALLIERLVKRAQGNPFYVEELLNHLHDRGLDPHRADALVQLDWPVSLRSLVLSRIDCLSAPLPLLLKGASVLGQRFTLSDLQACQLGAAAGGQADEPQSLLDGLKALAQAGLVAELPDPAEPRFGFVHRVTQEVAYDSIAQPGRVHLHQRVAEHLEAASAAADNPAIAPVATGGRAQVLAHHWSRAERPDKARPHLLRAGEQAAASYANEMALSAFTQVLAWLPEAALQERVSTLLRREALCDLMGRHEARRHDLAELAQLAGRLQGPAAAALQAQLALRQAQLKQDIGDFAAAVAGALAALAALKALPVSAPARTASGPAERADIIEALLLQARALFAAGRAEAARTPLDEALAQARQQHMKHSEATALSLLGLVEWQLGRYDAAQAGLLAALPGLQQAGDLRRELDVHNNLGVVAKARARFDEAVASYERALAIARRIGDRSGQAILLNNMGTASLAAGDFERAAHFTDQAATIWKELQEPSQHGVALINRAEAHRELGQYAAAQALGEQALAALRTSGARRAEAAVLENLGRVCMAVGDVAGAGARLQAALELAREIGLRSIEASSLMDIGRLQTAAGEFDAADRALQAAAALMGELGDPLGDLEVQAARAEWALAQDTWPGAERARGARAAVAPLLARLQATHGGPTAPLIGLPMPVVCVAWRVLQACGDSSAAELQARARAELRERAARISDPVLRRDYLQLAEHRALLAD
jgi:adenylate cyclase